MNNRLRLLPILGAVVFFQWGISRADIKLSAEQSAETPSVAATSPPTTAVTPLPTPAASTPTPALTPHTTNYTVVKGDSLTSLANKFNTTRRKLKELNGLADSKLSPGQVLLVPSYKKSAKSAAAVASAKAKAHHSYPQAQPVQDFDVPASTFASCPVPEPNEDADTTTAPASEETSAHVAQLVSPAEMAADEAATQKKLTRKQKAQQQAAIDNAVAAAALQVTSTPAPIASTNSFSVRRFAGGAPAQTSPSSTAKPTSTTPATNHGGLLAFFRAHPAVSTPNNDWGNRFIAESRALGAQGICYDESWRPPGETHSWDMDCSNTTRYLYKITAGINLPRTASDQYYYLHLQGKAWDVPTNAYGWADGNYLREHLRPGDLLFWENTYRPERSPPITHVMVFLGTNAQGQWIMAGSQSSRGGEHNRRNGGPDIYVFRPSQPCGGYTTWLGMVHHTGRFCAFGRPLEADPSKLASSN